MKKTTISQIMHKDVMTVMSTTSAQQCAVKMSKERVGCLIVLEQKKRDLNLIKLIQSN